jgi:hypothetical protein
MRLLNRLRWVKTTAQPCSPSHHINQPPVFASSNIRGIIDGIYGDELRGWIIDDSDPNRYIKLCLFANGTFLEKTSTCIFRKDLEQLFHSKGLHGFAFRIPEPLQSEAEWTAEIRLEDNRQLCGPMIVRGEPSRMPAKTYPRKPCLLVMHIPKTAVTAVRSALRNDPLSDRQLWLYGEPPGFPPEHILYLSEAQLKRAECVFGHFSFGFHMYFPQPVLYATLLRDPIERSISHYFQERLKSPDPANPARHLSLDEFVFSCSSIVHDNLMVRMLTGMKPAPFGSLSRASLDDAIDCLQRSFCYVGLQERAQEAVDSLAHYLGIKPNALQKENMGLYERENCASASCIRKLEEVNELDRALLDYVRDTFWSSGAEGWVNSRSAAAAV